MEEVNLLPVVTQKNAMPVAQPRNIIIADEPKSDTFSNCSLGGVVLAGAASAVTGKSMYHGAKAIFNKAITGFEKEIGKYCEEVGRQFKGIPNAVKVNVKYGAALLAGLATAALAFRDSDKDGNLDIVEACQKFITPES